MNRYKSLLTGIILLVLFFTVINNLDFSLKPQQEIYYSDFLNLLERDQVIGVVFRGEKIEGRLSDGNTFVTQSVYTPGLIEKLQEKQVSFESKAEEGTPWYINLFLQWGPLLLLIGVWIFLMRRMPGQGKIFSIGKSQAKKFESDPNKIVTFKDVAGADEAKDDLSEIIDFLKDPNKFIKIGGKIPRGVLMVGSPGTGKTLLAKAVAGESGVAFYSISGSDFVEMFVGVGASRVRELFEEARNNAPCIIFIDEIDAVGRHRGAGLGSSHDEREQTLNQLLVEMDGFDTHDGVIVIAATNRVDILDPALLRPGRFDRQVHVPLPDKEGRKAILGVHTGKVSLAKGVDLDIVARGTPGFSGADLANLVNESALWAARNNKANISQEDLDWARDKIMMGSERNSMHMTDEEKKSTAYHEAGHALVSAFVKSADPIHKITILPRGRSLGQTAFLPEADRLSYDAETLISKITVSMGGRVAEELIFDDISTGAENDIKQATQIANNMICNWGMSEKLGALTVQSQDSGNFLAMDYSKDKNVSDETQKIVDEEVQSLLKKCHNKAKEILTDHMEKLHELAKALIEKETLSSDQFKQLIGISSEPQGA